MLNSEEEPNWDAVLDTVFGLLEEARVAQMIDAPINEVTAQFMADRGAPANLTEAAFVESVAAFVAHVYAHAVPVPQALSATQARMEALDLLERCYESSQTRGYDGALLDALRYGDDGMAAVLAALAERLKVQERERHFHWVMASQVIMLPWRSKCRLVERLLDTWGDLLPEDIRALPVKQLGYLCDGLIKDYLLGMRALERVLSCRCSAPESPDIPLPS